MRIGIFLIVGILIGAAIFIGQTQSKPKIPPSPTLTASPTESVQPEKIDIHATFTIRTDNITRNFSNPKYHNKSIDVFLKADDPTVVHVEKRGITWSDFFATLPMKLTKDCLITGDGETLCDGKEGMLKFYLNDAENKELLDKEIQDGDTALITFTSL